MNANMNTCGSEELVANTAVPKGFKQVLGGWFINWGAGSGDFRLDIEVGVGKWGAATGDEKANGEGI